MIGPLLVEKTYNKDVFGTAFTFLKVDKCSCMIIENLAFYLFALSSEVLSKTGARYFLYKSTVVHTY